MAKIVESRQPDFGSLVLRAKDFQKDGYDLPMRPTLLGIAVTGRQTGAGGLGHYLPDYSSHGDIIGGLLWPNDGKKREMPAWAFAWPAILPGKEKTEEEKKGAACVSAQEDEKDKDGKKGNSPKDVYPMTATSFKESGPGGGIVMTPQPDRRFKSLQPMIPLKKGTKLPAGTSGIVLCMTREDKQEEVFFPINIGGVANAIFAINAAGDRDMGTTVYDTNKNFEPNEARKARLQSMMWVLTKPTDFKVSLTYPGIEGFLGWNIFQEGAGRGTEFAWGGAVVDFPPAGITPPGAKERVVGMASHKYAGPFLAGAKKDKHQIAVTDKGDECAQEKPINALHLNPHANWLMMPGEDGVQGGPGTGLPEGGGGGGGECHLSLDPPDTEPLDGPLAFGGAISEDILNRIKDFDNPTNTYLEFWEHEANVELGTPDTEDSNIVTGSCIEHPFFEKVRNGKWKWRSSCAGKESEGGGAKGGGGE